CLSDRSAGASELNPITGCDSTDMTSLLIWSILSPFADISKLARNEDAVSGYQVVQSKDAEHNRLVTQVTNPDQFGKGFRDEFLNDRINSRTRERRSSNCVSNRSSSSTAEPYHSGGIWSTSGQSELSGKLSILLSHGSKLSHPVIPA